MLKLLRTCAVLAIALTLPYAGLADASHGNLAQLVLSTVDALPTKAALKAKEGEGWRTYTYKDWEARSLKLAAWMLEQGIQKGDRIAILCFNRPEWAFVDLAGHMAGATVVPMYPSLTGPQHNYILHDAEIKIWFVMDATYLEGVRRLAGALDKVKVVGMLDPKHWPPASKEKLKEIGASEAPKDWPQGTQLLSAIIEGADVPADAVAKIKDRIRSVSQDDLATICYTSGTTSAPPAQDGTMVYAGKGVMLTHKNLISNVDAISSAVQLGPKDTFLSILPLAHMFERTCGYYAPVARGGTIAYAVSPQSFIDDMGDVKPTVFACVPLLFERMYQKIVAVGDKKPVNATIGAITNVADFFGADREHVSAALDAKKMRLLGKLLRNKTGGKLRFAVSGGAALSKDLAEFFLNDAKILILEGYGLTETSPVLTCNRPEAFRFGTIGKPVKGVELKIAEDGEILARGDNVMKGYLNNPEETAKAIDDQGWFHSGDLGSVEQDGFVKITGRKKSLFKLSTGKYIAPEKIENKLVHELIAQSVVVGENQKVAGCLIFPNLPAMRSYAKAQGVSGDDATLCKDAKVRAAYEKLIKDACAELPDWEKVKPFALVPVTLSIDSGELTPTMKVKRGVISVKFKAEIEAIFKE